MMQQLETTASTGSGFQLLQGVEFISETMNENMCCPKSLYGLSYG